MKAWTFEKTYSEGRSNHYSIKLNGVTQPFGAIFFNKRGDRKDLVEIALRHLNHAHEQGKTSTHFYGVSGLWRADWSKGVTAELTLVHRSEN